MKEESTCIINEQGDLGLFTELSEKDQKAYNEATKEEEKQNH